MKLHDWTIDVGNSRTKWAAFREEEMVQTGFWDILDEVTILAALTNLPARAILLSTVADVLPTGVEATIRESAYLLYLEETTLLPFENTYRTPATLGKDRLAAVAGAQALYPGQHCLVIDAGTCMTADFLEAGRTYRGGNISPGVQMRLRAMHEFTARLPLVESTGTAGSTLLGDTTESALRNGGAPGLALEIEALYQRLISRYGEVVLVLTGGDGTLLETYLKERVQANAATCSIFVQPNLVLLGLKQILQYNV